jgi:CIC family chloride channel protein
MDEVMEKFDSTDASMLPVIDSVGHLKGYVARAHLYSQYRQMVADMSAE